MAQEIIVKRPEAASPRGEAASCRFKREVVANGQKIVFHLERKPVKNLNLRIRRDGSVFVSASRTVSCAEIDRFVRSKSKYVLAAIQKFKDAIRFNPQPKKYVSGETFYIQGRGLRLKVSQANKVTIASDRTFIYLKVKDPADYRQKSRMVKRFLDAQCREVFEGILDEMYPKFRKYGIERPSLRIRNLKMRWGSCLAQKKVITINRRLLEAPRHYIEYVVLHELCHLMYPNHSKEFYCFLSMIMPDWKVRKHLLDKALTSWI